MKKFRWSLPGFTLDCEPLWNHAHGPRWEESHSKLFAHASQELRKRFHSGDVGFYDWPTRVEEEEITKLKQVARRLRQDFEGALLFGIGGSFLGAAALLKALRDLGDEEIFPLHWVSNVDGSALKSAVHFASKRKCAAIVISKSGGTTETLSAFFHLSHLLDPKGFVVITDPNKGELRRLSQANGWESFPVPPNIGGRFSVLTAVGLLPLLLGNVDIDPILHGARDMRSQLESSLIDDNAAYLLALSKFLWDTKHKHNIFYLMPYESSLRLIGDWYVQLWAESLGKKMANGSAVSVGFTPVAALGTSDQHSLLQLFKEGPLDKVIGFLDVFSGEKQTRIGKPTFSSPDFAFLFPHSFEEINHLAQRATEKSLQNSMVPTYRFEFKEVTPYALGALLFFLETACAFAGQLYEVDAFDQPGVEEAKRLLRASL